MRKFLPLLAFALVLAAPSAHAQQYCPSGADGQCDDVGGVTYECDTSQQPYVCKPADTGTGLGNVAPGGSCSTDGDCSGNYACINKTCQYDPSLEDQGTAAPGGACTSNDQCGGGQTCSIPAGAASGTCGGSTGAPTTNASTGFVPLAPIPGLDDNQSSVSASSLPLFFNNLYKYLIGLAAILALIEIIYAGIRIATNQDNVGTITESRGRITRAILGLVLILLPALVFGIINPSILNLSVNLPALNTAPGNYVSPTGTIASSTSQTYAAGATTITSNIMICPNNAAGTGQDCTATQTQCNNRTTATQLYVPIFYCADATTHAYSSTDSPVASPTNTCPSGKTLIVNCETGSSNYQPI